MTIYQGGIPLDEKDYQSHVYSLCQLDNVGVLLGAGSSTGCGGWTMKKVWQEFKKYHTEQVNKLINTYYLVDPLESENDLVNVELLIDEASKFLSVAKTRKQDDVIYDFNSILKELYKAVTKAALLTGDDFPDKNQGRNDKFNDHKELISKLMSNRQPGQSAPALFTTNYDLALEWAAEDIGVQLFNGFSGLHTRQFYPQNFDLSFRNVNAKGEARFGHYHSYLYKLHGSLTWHQDDSLSITEVSASQAYDSYLKKVIEGEELQLGQYLIYPGANKYSHTIGFVYGEMFRRFSEFLSKPQTAIFINGFGFGDYHINRIILGALLNPSLHVVIYYPNLESAEANVGLNIASEGEKTIVRIKNMALKQITVVGGGERAYFSSFVKDLPYPVLFPRINGVDDLVQAIVDLTQEQKK
ncbi:SIR2 family protein [Yersinia sp. J1]|uniref:SIR2 family protein n=1 Tax=Yersinia sp. J1 TaxID=3424774 RepID=UPI003D365BA2